MLATVFQIITQISSTKRNITFHEKQHVNKQAGCQLRNTGLQTQ